MLRVRTEPRNGQERSWPKSAIPARSADSVMHEANCLRAEVGRGGRPRRERRRRKRLDPLGIGGAYRVDPRNEVRHGQCRRCAAAGRDGARDESGGHRDRGTPTGHRTPAFPHRRPGAGGPRRAGRSSAATRGSPPMIVTGPKRSGRRVSASPGLAARRWGSWHLPAGIRSSPPSWGAGPSPVSLGRPRPRCAAAWRP